MNAFLKTFLLTIFLFVSTASTFAQKQIGYEKLDEYIQKSVGDFKAPGFSIGIIKDGEVVFKKGYGIRNSEVKDPVTTQSVYAIASCTKAFTAAALGICVDRGLLNWDDKVVDYLPWFRLYDPYITKEATIRDLVTHRMGFKTFDGDLLWYGTNYSSKEVVQRIGNHPLLNGFRAKYGYSNVMFITAGLVVEAVSGKSWDEFIEEEIFNKLEMNSSSTSITKFKSDDNLTTPHVKGKPIQWINYDNSGSAASINSNVDDLLKWVKVWLNTGRINDEEELFSEVVYNEITTPQTIRGVAAHMNPEGTHFILYGMGWYLKDYSGREIIYHDGGLPGFISKVLFVPEENLGIVMLANDLVYITNPIENKILDMFLNEKDIDYSSETLKRVEAYYSNLEANQKEKEESRNLNTELSKDLKSYSGLYRDNIYGDAEITISEGELNVTLLPTAKLFTSRMEHWQNDTFRIKFKDEYLPEGYIIFSFDNDDNINGFKIDLPNPDFHFYNLNFKKIN